MGEGIVHRLVVQGMDALLVDCDGGALKRVEKGFAERASWRSRVSGISDRDLDRTVGEMRARLRISSSLRDVFAADYIIETISERLADKVKLYNQLAVLANELGSNGVPIASNTSVIPIDTLSRVARRNGTMVGIHFMNPADLISSVEVVFPKSIGEATERATRVLLTRLGLSFVVAEDNAGFISNRILMPMINEAVRLLDGSANRPESIDAVFRRSMGHKMGPLETADLIGLDTIKFSLENLASLLESDFYLPAHGLVKLVTDGKLGVKSGSGFYDY